MCQPLWWVLCPELLCHLRRWSANESKCPRKGRGVRGLRTGAKQALEPQESRREGVFKGPVMGASDLRGWERAGNVEGQTLWGVVCPQPQKSPSLTHRRCVSPACYSDTWVTSPDSRVTLGRCFSLWAQLYCH